jgi:group I intron endonuclease
MSQGIIYLIINKENGSKFVGQTTTQMNKVWKQHIHDSNRMSPKPIHRAFRKFGVDKFTMKVIDECHSSLLDEKELYWIERYNTYLTEGGYNDAVRVISQDDVPKVSVVLNSTNNTSKIKPWGTLTEENRGNGKHCGLRIMGINIETGESKEWENAREAALEVAGDRNRNSNILLSARKGYKAYGYRWKLLENKSKKKAVRGVCKRTWQEVSYESITEATRSLGNGTRSTGIRDSLRNPNRHTWKGYYWFYDT